jgi:hypothetical protein
MTLRDRLAGTVIVAGVLSGVVWGSNAPMSVHPSADAMLRVAWSAFPERVEICREAPAEELARLPAHMRQRLVCEGRAATYRLTVRAGGVAVVDRVVQAGGVRHDRRLYVFHEAPVPATALEIDVRFERVEATVDGAASTSPSAQGSTAPHASREWIPARLAYVDRLRPTPGSVVLITYDAGRRALVARTATRTGQ